MTGIDYLLGGGEALIVIFVCYLMMRHVSRLPSMTHPVANRLIIAGMFCAGVVLAATSLGLWVIAKAHWLGGLTGGTNPGDGIGWSLVTIGALLLAASVAVALIWDPNPSVAYLALVTPLMLALVPGGFLHQAYVFVSSPAASAVNQVAHSLGG